MPEKLICVGIHCKIALLLLIMTFTPALATGFMMAGNVFGADYFLAFWVAVMLAFIKPLSRWLAEWLVIRDIHELNRFCLAIKDGKSHGRLDLPNETADEDEWLRLKRNMNWMVHAIEVREKDLVRIGETLAERERQQAGAQRMEALGHLAGGVAHNFNNMLMGISGTCELALMRLEEGHPSVESLNSIMDAIQRAGRLTSQILAFCRRQIVKPEDINLTVILLEMADLLEQILPTGIDLDFSLSPEIEQGASALILSQS